jgi:methionyl-tRNA formyltransferase
MRFGFVTCVQLGLSCIEAVLEAGGRFELLITLPDHWAKSKSGRIYLDEVSGRTGTPLMKVRHINDPAVAEAIRQYQIDWLFIIGWSQIADRNVLAAPTKGIIGAHPTLLPTGRGRAAIPWAIIKGLERTGVTFFRMDEGVDTGDIVGQLEILMHEGITATELYHMVDEAHVHLIRDIWPSLVDGSCRPRPQDESLATYWEGRTPADGELRHDMSVSEVERLVRGTTKPYPGAFLKLEGRELVIWSGKAGIHHEGLTLNFSDGSYTATEYEYR